MLLVLLLGNLGFLGLGLRQSGFGVAWPHMQADLGVPVGAVGFLLVPGAAGFVLGSVTGGFTVARVGAGWLLAGATALSALALLGHAVAPALVVLAVAALFLGYGAGVTDGGLNAYAGRHFGARNVTWLHASFGLGATLSPLLMTGVITVGLGWRWGYGTLAVLAALLAVAYAVTARAWSMTAAWSGGSAPAASNPATAAGQSVTAAGQPGTAADRSATAASQPAGRAGSRPVAVAPPPVLRTLALPGLWLGVALFMAQVAVELSAGVWAYTLLTEGRGMTTQLAGAAVSAYWVSMLVGRLVAGAVTDWLGTRRVLTAGVAGMAAGAALVAVPGPGWLTVAGLMVVGLGAAPMFPLLVVTTSERVGRVHADRAVGLQVAVAALGGSTVPAVVGVLIGWHGAAVLGPALLLLVAVLAVLHWAARRP